MPTHNFQLVGPHAGKTINLGGYQFVKGVYEFETDQTDFSGLVTYLERSYNAHLVDSPELKAAEAAYAVALDIESGKTPEPSPVPNPQLAPPETPAPDAKTVASVVGALDPADDGVWTGTGLPSVEAVSAAVGAKVSREDIEAAHPGFNRAAAKAAAAI
jgi:hypothetical protein